MSGELAAGDLCVVIDAEATRFYGCVGRTVALIAACDKSACLWCYLQKGQSWIVSGIAPGTHISETLLRKIPPAPLDEREEREAVIDMHIAAVVAAIEKFRDKHFKQMEG